MSSLQTEYLNLDNRNSGSSKQKEKKDSANIKCTYCGLSNHSVEKCFKKIRQEKEKARSAGTSSKKIRIVQLGNALDADLKIILSQNFPIHLKRVRKDASLTNLRKKAIV